jgi:hypothetical protein
MHIPTNQPTNKLIIYFLLITAAFLFACDTVAPKKEDDSTNNLLLLTAVANQPNCTNCSCALTNSCIEYSASAWNSGAARRHCTSSLFGTFSETSKCIATASLVGTCTGTTRDTPSLAAISYTYDYYSSSPIDFPTSENVTIPTTTSSTTVFGLRPNCVNAAGSGTGSRVRGTFTKPTNAARIRFRNSSGSNETYTLHNSATCGAGTLVQTIGAVANGSTSSYNNVTEGLYAISFNSGTTCSVLGYQFSNGNVWTVTSGTTTYSVAATTE